MSTFILSVVQKNPFPKLKLYFEYVDKANGLYYPHTVAVPFSVDETLPVSYTHLNTYFILCGKSVPILKISYPRTVVRIPGILHKAILLSLIHI